MSSYFTHRDFCPACEHEDSVQIISRSMMASPIIEMIRRNFDVTGMDLVDLLKEQEYQLRVCNKCGLVFQRNCFTEEFMEEIYERRAQSPEVQSRDTVKPLHRSAYYAAEIVALVKMLNRKPSEIDVLDFGMGWGHWCYMAKAYGCNVFGLDPSRTKQQFARANGITAITVNDLKEEMFDYINTEQVIEHVLRPLDAVKKLRASLKPGGILKISVPNGTGLNKERLLVDWNHPVKSAASLVSPLMHINTFKYDTVVDMAEKAGLALIQLPLRCQYSNLHFLNINQGAKGILRPLYRKFARTTYLHFSPK